MTNNHQWLIRVVVCLAAFLIMWIIDALGRSDTVRMIHRQWQYEKYQLSLMIDK